MQLLTYKAEETCGQLVPVNPAYTHQRYAVSAEKS